ncbi:MAG: MoaD/ThiS family protein [Saprospiraceae bacterium]|nr:MoaD/ThiS family protein [Saprospiraceae bacterium]
MPIVRFTAALTRFFPDLKPQEIDAQTINEILISLNNHYAGISDFLIDEHGNLRPHINIFIGERMITDREKLSDLVSENEEILIFQALSGG